MNEENENKEEKNKTDSGEPYPKIWQLDQVPYKTEVRRAGHR